jgi:hypothetical protein
VAGSPHGDDSQQVEKIRGQVQRRRLHLSAGTGSIRSHNAPTKPRIVKLDINELNSPVSTRLNRFGPCITPKDNAGGNLNRVPRAAVIRMAGCSTDDAPVPQASCLRRVLVSSDALRA